MSSKEDHRWRVSTVNMTTGGFRAWRHMPLIIHVGWLISMCLYTFIGWETDSSAAYFIAWEVFFAVAWAAAWSLMDRVFS